MKNKNKEVRTCEIDLEISPCIGCRNEMKDKNLCVGNCVLIEKYRNRKPVMTDIVKKVETLVHDKLKCLECGAKGKMQRGLCLYCYQRWRKGRIKHPVEGMFVSLVKPDKKTKGGKTMENSTKKLKTTNLKAETIKFIISNKLSYIQGLLITGIVDCRTNDDLREIKIEIETLIDYDDI